MRRINTWNCCLLHIPKHTLLGHLEFKEFALLLIPKLKSNSTLNIWRPNMKTWESPTLHQGKTRALRWFIHLLTDNFTVWLPKMEETQNIQRHVHLPEEAAFYNSTQFSQAFVTTLNYFRKLIKRIAYLCNLLNPNQSVATDYSI